MAFVPGICPLRVKPDRTDRLPVSGIAGPSGRMALTGCLVDRVPSGKQGLIFAAVTLLGCDEADGAVVMFGIVPGCEAFHPETCVPDRGEPFRRPCRPILAGSEQGLSSRGYRLRRGAG